MVTSRFNSLVLFQSSESSQTYFAGISQLKNYKSLLNYSKEQRVLLFPTSHSCLYNWASVWKSQLRHFTLTPMYSGNSENLTNKKQNSFFFNFFQIVDFNNQRESETEIQLLIDCLLSIWQNLIFLLSSY